MALTRTSFKKGEAKGKPKGAQNKLTKSARELFVQTLEMQVPNILGAFDDVREKDSAKYLELFAKYAQYFVPKQMEVKQEVTEVKQVFKIGNVEIEL